VLVGTQICICDHPLAQYLLTRLRDYQTSSGDFRRYAMQLSSCLVYEALRELQWKPVGVDTPLGPAQGVALTDYLVLAPVLRAGLVLCEAAQPLVPNARIYHIGLRRDEKTLLPETYYERIPESLPPESRVLVLDPMLATGGSTCAAVSLFARLNVAEIQVVCFVAAPEGIKKVQSAFPQVKIITASVDHQLNEHGYIVPGLGDAGDRLFST
jgi:uracil phosphoribosyltransferase